MGLDDEISAVLMQLALTSNGSTTRLDANRGGGRARHYSDSVPQARHAAPHEHFRDLYEKADSDADRNQVIRWAREELRRTRRGRGDVAHTAETQAELFARIVHVGEGVPKADVAIWARTSQAMVARARREADPPRDPDFGRRPRPRGRINGEELRVAARELEDDGMSARAIAFTLGIGYNTARRYLGRKA